VTARGDDLPGRAAGPPSPRHDTAQATLRTRTAWTFLAPLLIALALTAAWPLLRTMWFSLTDAFLSDAANWTFVGLQNYALLAQDPRWWRAVGNTLLFVAVSVSLETALGLVIALVLNANMPGRGLTRAVMLIPWAIPTVVSAKMWAWMLNDLNGVVNAAARSIGLVTEPIPWLADPVLSMASVIAVDVWKATPFMTLLTLAALQAIPQDAYESARMDGAGPIRIFASITLPLIMPALLVAVTFRALDALRVFDVVYVLTGATSSTATMSIYARQQLTDFQDVGMGSTAATCLFLIIALVVAIFLTIGRVDLEARGSAS
jgi:trehalose/maltose transport system permease protein